MSFTVLLEPEAEADLDAIKDKRTYKAIEAKLDELETEPDKRGKKLSGNLKRYRSVKAAGQRYRIIYDVVLSEKMVNVVVIGIRKEGDKHDAYAVAEKRLGFLLDF